jgi:hypothetical protein
MLMEDMYKTMIEPKIVRYRDDWDNKSDDDVFKKGDDKDTLGGWLAFNKPYYSYRSCSKACLDDARCFQFSYTDGECGFGAAFKLGWKSEPRDNHKRKSGWHLDKIAKFMEENKCNGPAWEKYS